MMLIHLFAASFSPTGRACGLSLCLAFFLILVPLPAADIEMEGYLGETITLHGSSYIGDSVYLFLTGPGLPADGVTLTDTSQRADQGHFTVVRLNDDQEWTYIWKTSRIANEIDPGTYTVYVTNEPADLSHLGGSSRYKTLSVFLKDSGESKVSINAGQVYTLNPERETPTPRPAPSVNITTIAPTTAITSLPPETTAVPPPPPATTALPPTRAGPGVLASVVSLAGIICLVSFLKCRR